MGPRKAWFLSDVGSGNYTPVWIEGIGSLAGILTPDKQPNLIFWDFPELLCFEKDGIIEFKSNNGATYGCQLESIGLEEFTNLLQVNIAPNPIADKSLITFSNPKHYKMSLQIFDTMGRLVVKKETTNNNFILAKRDYDSGIYFYQIHNNQTCYKSKFIIR